MLHVFIALIIQFFIALCSNFFVGAIAASAFFIGREITQAEYRNIATNYGGKRANMPWYGGFEPKAWTTKGMLDWILPTASVFVVAFLINMGAA